MAQFTCGMSLYSMYFLFCWCSDEYWCESRFAIHSQRAEFRLYALYLHIMYEGNWERWDRRVDFQVLEGGEGEYVLFYFVSFRYDIISFCYFAN